MEAPDSLVDAVEGIALASVIACSAHPASEALTVPGEPRLVNGMILNCIRFPVQDEDAMPDMDDVIAADERITEVNIDPECHFVNVHDVTGKWRVDFSFHYAYDDNENPVGVAGVIVMDTTRLPAQNSDGVVEQLDLLSHLLLKASEIHDERWKSASMTTLH